MKRFGLIAGVLAVSAMCAGQMMPSHPQTKGTDTPTPMQSPHGVQPSSRTMFGQECGISDVSSKSALGFSRSPEGTWSAVSEGMRPGPKDNAVARVWRESNWMVDLHDAPGSGTSIHTGQMCFDGSGKITRMIDRYMDIPACDCMRYTSLNFDANGAVVKQEQKYVNVSKGGEIAAPEAAKGFPEVFGFRKVEQLPFYSLVKK